ncbi:MAG: glycoside hydrolase family 16 protein [Pedobacter sp.]|uniref:glycoside hydrolase family 16 protein n=1 Tax=Pedobacter sp. TaxID=1411316 RepID=UPI00356AD78F
MVKHTKILIVVLSLTLLASLVVASIGNTPASLAPNPSFETNPTTSYYTNGNSVFLWDLATAHFGTHSLKISSKQTSGAFSRWMSKTNVISAQAGQTYSGSVWMKDTGTGSYGKFVITFWNSGQGYLGSYESISVLPTSVWTQVTAQGVAPANTAFVRVEFRLYGPGTLWVDDVILNLKSAVTPTPTPSGWTLLCGEEFNAPIDPAKWKVYSSYDQNGATSDTRFMSSMTTVSNGILHLGIAMNPLTGKKYIGGGLDNEPDTKCSTLTQGRWEVRAKMPKGFGTDGYIGLYGNPHKWPPEIIITENIGKRRTINYIQQIYGTSTDPKYDVTQVIGDTWDTSFHTYVFEWEGTTLRWYIDGVLKKTANQLYSSYPMKIGAGAWSGTCGSTWPDCASSSVLPAYMDIDYVRIYQKN